MLFASRCFCIIQTLQRPSLFSNSEINISVAPWSSFYTFKEILCTKQPLRNNPEVFCKKRSESLCQSLSLCVRVSFLIKLQAWPGNLKKRLWHSCFPVNFVKFLRTPQGYCFWPFADVSKIDVLKISKRLQQKTPTQVFSCDYCEIFTNSFFIEHFRWLLLHLILFIFSSCKLRLYNLNP